MYKLFVPLSFLCAALLPVSVFAYQFSYTLTQGSRGPAVFELQKLLNANPRTRIALSGAGSPGNETDYFGPATTRAVIRFQELHREEVLAPANLSYGTGVVGVLTRQKLNSFFKVATQTPTVTTPASATRPSTPSLPVTTQTTPPQTPTEPSPPAQTAQTPAVPVTSPEPAKPAVTVTGVSPSQVRPGEKVTVFGSGFTQSGNTVTLAYAGLTRQFSNVFSLDGKTVSFYFEAPELKVTREFLKKLPPEAYKEIEDAVTKAGGTLDDIITPYRELDNEKDLENLIARYGFTIRDLYDEFYVTVENENGVGRSHAAVLAGLRKLDFSSFARRHFQKFLSHAANIALLFPETAQAQQGGGVYTGPTFYCTCGPGHLGLLTGQGPGLTYFPPGFVPVTGTTQSAGYWLGIYSSGGGACPVVIGLGCGVINAALPVYWGQGPFGR
jgi:peptidoglycan hydrolase-like protein with peptidoglycan-binding domain